MTKVPRTDRDIKESFIRDLRALLSGYGAKIDAEDYSLCVSARREVGTKDQRWFHFHLTDEDLEPNIK